MRLSLSLSLYIYIYIYIFEFQIYTFFCKEDLPHHPHSTFSSSSSSSSFFKKINGKNVHTQIQSCFLPHRLLMHGKMIVGVSRCKVPEDIIIRALAICGNAVLRIIEGIAVERERERDKDR